MDTMSRIGYIFNFTHLWKFAIFLPRNKGSKLSLSQLIKRDFESLSFLKDEDCNFHLLKTYQYTLLLMILLKFSLKPVLLLNLLIHDQYYLFEIGRI